MFRELSFKRAFLFYLFCLCVQKSSAPIEYFGAEDVEFSSASRNSWSASIQGLKEGSYYISIGRPMTPCELRLDGKIISTNKSVVEGYRTQLLISGSFQKTSESSLLEIQCAHDSIWSSRLTHKPIITSLKLGNLLHLWRALTELLIGPLSSMLLLFFVLVNYRHKSSHNSAVFLFFACTSLFYSISLAYYTRLFLDSFIAGVLHIILRNMFSIAALAVFYSFAKKPHMPSFVVHIVLLVVVLLCGFFLPEKINEFYYFNYFFFPLTSLICSWKLYSQALHSETGEMIRDLSFAWTFIQTLDLTKLLFNFGPYTGPSLILLMSLIFIYVRVKQRLRSEKIHSATSRILRTIEAKRPLSEIFTQIASITAGETSFKRVSAYIDGFCIGLYEHPRHVFYRIMENGYSKDTQQDKVIYLKDGNGQYISEATNKGEMTVRQGSSDRAYFIVIPIGAHATINLSDEKPASKFSVYEGEEILRGVYPSLSSLNTKIIAQGFRLGLALEKLRLMKGDGRFECEVGSIFADINEYSTLTEKYGNAFSEFINNVYFPSLVKALNKTASPEFIRGDEIYFICIAELTHHEKTVAENVFISLLDFQNFVHTIGAELCEQNGYKKITFSIGATNGSVTLICDPIQVRTVGPSVNAAKRLQEAAGKDSILTHITGLTETQYKEYFDQETTILHKKNFLRARKLFYRNAQFKRSG